MCHEIRCKKSLRRHYPLCADCYITPHAYIGGIWTAQVKNEDKHVSNLWSPLTVATQLSWNITSASPLQIKFPCAPGISVGVATHSQPEVARDQIGVKNMGRRKSFNHESTCSFQKTSIFSGRSPQKPSIFHQFGAKLWWFRRTTEVIISEKVTVLVFLADLGEATQYFK